MKINEKLISKSCCIVMPSYNNVPKLSVVLDALIPYKQHLIIVDDGCTDGSSEVLFDFSPLALIKHSTNKGKGKALQAGFQKAIELGFKYAITIDSDGQHFPKDMIRFLDAIDDQDDLLVVGVRNMSQEGVPNKSSLGNRFSNFWYWAETGVKLPDTQSGYRLYPLSLMKNMRFYTRKFEFEVEVLVRLAWRGARLSSVPIDVAYEDDRISHFKPFKDFSRISILNTVLFIIALFWMHPIMYFKKVRQKGIKKYLLDITIQSEASTFNLALSSGFGVFMGIVPIWGYQLVSAIALAYLFKLNKPIVILTANISIPPFTILILYLSYLTGYFFYGGSLMLNFSEISFSTVKQDAMQYLVGSIFFAIIMGIIVTIVSYFIFRKLRRQLIIL